MSRVVRNWLIMAFVTVVLLFAGGAAQKWADHQQWMYDGHLVLEQAQDELERLGVTGQVTEDTGADRARRVVAGHVKTERGTQPFFVRFTTSNGERVVQRVTLGDKVLFPEPRQRGDSFDVVTGLPLQHVE